MYTRKKNLKTDKEIIKSSKKTIKRTGVFITYKRSYMNLSQKRSFMRHCRIKTGGYGRTSSY